MCVCVLVEGQVVTKTNTYKHIVRLAVQSSGGNGITSKVRKRRDETEPNFKPRLRRSGEEDQEEDIKDEE